MKKLLLASSSPYRRKLLEQLQLPFETRNPSIDETAQPGETAVQLVERLSHSKARALASEYPEHLIIGSDQAGGFGGEIIGKPGNTDAARQQLRKFSGKTVQFATGACAYHPASGRSASEVVITEVRFQSLTDTQIATYLEREQPFDCAGSFKCEGLGISLFEWIRSDDPTALVGLPLIALTRILAAFGLHPLNKPDQ